MSVFFLQLKKIIIHDIQMKAMKNKNQMSIKLIVLWSDIINEIFNPKKDLKCNTIVKNMQIQLQL